MAEMGGVLPPRSEQHAACLSASFRRGQSSRLASRCSARRHSSAVRTLSWFSPSGSLLRIECRPNGGHERCLRGVIGPQIVTHTMNLWRPYLFTSPFQIQASATAKAALALVGVRLPRPAPDDLSRRPLIVILSQPRFISAVTCGAVSYLQMNLVITTAPLAMRLSGDTQEDANLGLQWHVIAMAIPKN